MKKIFIALIAVLISFSAHSAGKGRNRAFDEIAGLWRGQVQFVVHNARSKEPDYFHVGWLVLSVDKMGRVLGRADNDCAVDGLITPMVLNSPSRLDLMMYRCPNPELIRRFKGTLNRRGEFVLSWEMMDGNYEKTVSVTGILFQD